MSIHAYSENLPLGGRGSYSLIFQIHNQLGFVFFFKKKILFFNSIHTLMQTGVTVKIIENQLMAIAFIQVITLFHGALRNKVLYDSSLRQSIKLFPPLLSRPFGYKTFSEIFMFPYLELLSYGVIILERPFYHAKTKHMDINYHFIRDRVAAKAMQDLFCSSKDQIANGFTKLVCTDKFHFFWKSLNVFDTLLDSTGCINISDHHKHYHKQPGDGDIADNTI